MKMGLKKLSNETLVDAFEEVIRWHHYDPFVTPKPFDFSIDEFKKEILYRFRRKPQKHGACCIIQDTTPEDECGGQRYFTLLDQGGMRNEKTR